MIEINNLKQMEKYYDKELNTYIFNDDVCFYFNLNIDKNIDAYDIDAWNINANDINACDINACDINAKDINASDIIAHKIDANNISFYAFCCVYESLKCKSIKGRRRQSKIICLDNDIEIKGE